PGVDVFEQRRARRGIGGVAGEIVAVELPEALESVLVAALGLVLSRPVVKPIVGHGVIAVDAENRGGDRVAQLHLESSGVGAKLARSFVCRRYVSVTNERWLNFIFARVYGRDLVPVADADASNPLSGTANRTAGAALRPWRSDRYGLV